MEAGNNIHEATRDMCLMFLGGKVFNVWLTKKDSRDPMYLMGETDFIEQTICIDKDLRKDRQREVLLREAILCILDAAGDIRSGDDTQLISTIASGLNNILTSNQWILSLFEFEF